MIKAIAFGFMLAFSTNVFAGVGGSIVPSTDSVEVAKRIIYQQIYNNPSMAKMVDMSRSTFDWKQSAIEGLHYGIFWTDFNLPDGRVSRNPFRFYVKDRGRSSLVFLGAFLDANGRIPDADLFQPKVSGGVEDKLSQREIIEVNPWVVVKKGVDSKRVVVFTDPDCPYCQKLTPELEALIKEPGVQLELYYTPIDQLHPNARMKSLVLLQLKPEDRLKAEHIVSGINSGDDTVLLKALAAKGFRPVKQYVSMANKTLAAGEQLAAQYGIRGTPNILVPSTKKAIQGYANKSKIMEKLPQ